MSGWTDIGSAAELSDTTHLLADAEGYRVRVYIPFGEQWYPYLMRRLAERPANLFFITGSILKESPVPWLARPMAIGAGAVAGALMALTWKRRS